MYIILVYDVDEKKCGKALKVCRQYLNHIQNSVFEGEIEEAQLFRLKKELLGVIGKSDTNSVIIFKTRNEKWLEREIIGVERRSIDNML